MALSCGCSSRGVRAGGGVTLRGIWPQSVQRLRWVSSDHGSLGVKNQDLLSKETGREVRRGSERQWWLRGCANGLGWLRVDKSLTPGTITETIFGKDPLQELCLQILLLWASPTLLVSGDPKPRTGLAAALAPPPPNPQGAQPHPRVAAQSPPPTRPREQALGKEFNRHHQQPPGRLGKVDT